VIAKSQKRFDPRRTANPVFETGFANTKPISSFDEPDEEDDVESVEPASVQTAGTESSEQTNKSLDDVIDLL
jgi:hypothetical protein